MIKYTSTGIKRLGSENELSQEDHKYIRGMFEEFASHEKSLDDLRDPIEDEMYGDV